VRSCGGPRAPRGRWKASPVAACGPWRWAQEAINRPSRGNTMADRATTESQRRPPAGSVFAPIAAHRGAALGPSRPHARNERLGATLGGRPKGGALIARGYAKGRARLKALTRLKDLR
jgi:hypothetical protein